jgi:hypothetical protein
MKLIPRQQNSLMKSILYPENKPKGGKDYITQNMKAIKEKEKENQEKVQTEKNKVVSKFL